MSELMKLKQEQEDKQNQELQTLLVKQGYKEGDKLVRDSQGSIKIWRYIGKVVPLWQSEEFKRKVQ